jgi:hypothetical protein
MGRIQGLSRKRLLGSNRMEKGSVLGVGEG